MTRSIVNLKAFCQYNALYNCVGIYLVTRLHCDGVGVHRHHAVHEYEDTDDSRGEEPSGVETCERDSR